MNVQHPQLAAGKWLNVPFLEQMANIGSEVGRAITWKNKKNIEYFELAFRRAVELLDLTIQDGKNRCRLKELLRVREALADYFLFNNEYGSTDEKWNKYFYGFNFAARKNI
jgi:hypothetical protein